MFELPKLPYSYEALEPHIDAKTMELHYTKHHQTYVTKLNEALKDATNLKGMSMEDLLIGWTDLPDALKIAVRNHGGGHANHSLFWSVMKPQGGGEPVGELSEGLNASFGDFTKFKEQFTKSAIGVFGSGWAWLVSDSKKKLFITTTANQDSPLMQNLIPLLGLDVWEHAYYLKHQSRRPDYVEAWWNVINWSEVEARLQRVQ